MRAVLTRAGYDVVRRDDAAVFHADVSRFCADIAKRGFRPKHILDVGANKGDWSRAARSVFPDAAFTLIEPQVEMAPFLDAFCAETKRARWINAGAAAAEGELNLTLLPNDPHQLASTFSITEDGAQRLGMEQRSVPVVTLDGVCASAADPLPDIVKIDVEGFESEVLAGARTLVGTTEVFLVELAFFRPHWGAKTFHEMVAVMAELGYRPYDFTAFVPRPLDGALGVCEMAFARNDGFLRSSLDWE